MSNKLTTLGQLRDAALGANQLIAEVAAAAAEAIEEAMPHKVVVILTASGWTGSAAPYTQTAAAEGVLADGEKQLVHILPESLDDWTAAGMRCTSQGAGTLTFTAQSRPGGDLKIYIVMQEVAG